MRAKLRNKYSLRIAKKICEMRATGNYRIKDICAHVGISHMCLLNWRKDIPEFAEMYEDAETERLDNIGELAESGLKLLLVEHEFEETTTEYKSVKHLETIEDTSSKTKITNTTYKPIKASEKTVKKKIMPNPTAVIFALTNRQREHWKNRQDINHKAEEGDLGFFGFLTGNSQLEEGDQYVKDTDEPEE